MYISIQEFGTSYLQVSIGKSHRRRKDSDCERDLDLLVDGVAARIHRMLGCSIKMERHLGEEGWTLLFEHRRDWKDRLEKVFTGLEVDFTWIRPDWLECQVNQYLINNK